MALSTRQKILIPVLAIVVILLIWQLCLMILDRYPVDNPFSTANELSLDVSTHADVLHLPEKKVTPIDLKQAAANGPDPIVNHQQSAYLQLVSEFQIAQIKRMIARDYEDIAVANRNTAKAMLDTTKMAGVGSVPQVSIKQMPVASKVNAGYRLVYTSREGKQWNATLRYQGKLLDIVAGSMLPDGAKVLTIDSNHITISKNHQQKLISFFATTTIPAQAKLPVKRTLAAKPKPSATLVKSTIKPLSIHLGWIEHLMLPQAAKPSIARPIMLLPVKAKAAAKPADTLATKTAKKTPAKSADTLATKTVKKTPAKPANTPATKTVKKTPAKSADTPITKTVKNTPPKPTRHYSQTELSLLHTAPHYYAIQLMANRNLAKIKRFVAINHLQGQTYHYKTTLQGKPWYILLYRQFPDTETALTAISELPIRLQRWLPVAKSYVQVHEELQKVG